MLDKIYTQEAELVKDVKKWLMPQFYQGIQLIRINDRYHKGYSDFFINARGRLICAELKDDIGVPSEHQKLFIKEAQRCGAKAGVCRSIRDVKNLIDAALYCSCEYGKGIKESTPASPRHNYKYCPMCGGELSGCRRDNQK